MNTAITVRHVNRVTSRPGRTVPPDGGPARYRSRRQALAAARSPRYDRDTRAEAAAGRDA